MSERRPVRDGYDAVIDLLPYGEVSSTAYALAKFTFAIEDGTLRLESPEPLLHDFRDPSLVPRLHPGTDFWPHKEATDFVVLGSAYAPGGLPAHRMHVSARFGEHVKTVRVYGRREVSWQDSGTPRIGAPEPFTEIALSLENAYGGIDRRVQTELTDERALLFMADVDHPGLYPRNPFGKGYVVGAPSPGLEMPNLEDPADPLVPERLLVRDPARWYEQPLPWSFGWVPAMTFPRYLFAGGLVDAWFPGPEDERMVEVRRGFLMAGYRSALERLGPDVVHPRFRQEAPYGMVIARVEGGELVEIKGMHPDEPTVSFTMPAFVPRMDFELDGRRLEAPPARLHSLVVRPAEKRVNMVFGTQVQLTRAFVPGLHKHIPLKVSIHHDQPIEYEAPPTRFEMMRDKGG